MHDYIYDDIICIRLFSVINVQIKSKLYKDPQARESFIMVAKESRKDVIYNIKFCVIG